MEILIEMNIIGKEYRTIVPMEVITENDVQGGYSKSLINTYLYIHDKKKVTQFASDYDRNNPNCLFGNIPVTNRNMKLENLRKIIEKGNDPVSIGKYSLLDNNKIEMKWNYYYGENIELIFKGEILLNGDAIKGTFYKNGEVSVPSRVYYNIDKPLPDPLIPEDDKDIA
ncbi:hypothetical protein SAMN05421766_101566 [Zobellia uliginosa]|uniref:MORN repeat variant n=1 Tax=Zobellia uliginosa TaxID=143224 RepID=A0ABY1KJ08_9FLAO|nr:hypothetical protein [Zobellia uliginosa]SIS40269.1 hypothetical protein SAMN05421766_101566 [Zobellia uliginosa]